MEGSTHVPQLSTSRKLDLEFGYVRVTHPACTDGASKAVMVGINYAGAGVHREGWELAGREKDVAWMHSFAEAHGYENTNNIRVLVDDGHEKGRTLRNRL